MIFSRREFLASTPALLFAPQLIHRDASAVRVALIHSPEFANAARAAEMSANEVRRAASLLRREFEFTATARAGAASAIFTSGDISVDVAGACGPNVLTLVPPRGQCRNQRCVVWHHSLERYGAGQLNDRFRAAGIPVDEQAWLGWFAVKLLWEAGVRDQHPNDLRFDGHKGTALYFNPGGVLMQPIYSLDADRVAEEIRPNRQFEAAICGS